MSRNNPPHSPEHYDNDPDSDERLDHIAYLNANPGPGGITQPRPPRLRPPSVSMGLGFGNLGPGSDSESIADDAVLVRLERGLQQMDNVVRDYEERNSGEVTEPQAEMHSQPPKPSRPSNINRSDPALGPHPRAPIMDPRNSTLTSLSASRSTSRLPVSNRNRSGSDPALAPRAGSHPGSRRTPTFRRGAPLSGS
ncbi:hypothetical protein IFR05_016292, partial [Cadophora sp. M221]